MSTQKMTIHRGLAEMKTIDAKITKGIQQIDPMGIVQKGKNVNGLHVPETFAENAKANYQSIVDLIERKRIIKNAIVLSNAKTRVTIAGKEMSVADAITAKANAAVSQLFIDTLKARARKAKSDLEKRNNEMEQRKENFIAASLGGDKSKSKPEEITALSKMFEDNNMFSIVDPLSIDKKIEVMETELQNFLTEVDAVLSETNATTFIAI